MGRHPAGRRIAAPCSNRFGLAARHPARLLSISCRSRNTGSGGRKSSTVYKISERASGARSDVVQLSVPNPNLFFRLWKTAAAPRQNRDFQRGLPLGTGLCEAKCSVLYLLTRLGVRCVLTATSAGIFPLSDLYGRTKTPSTFTWLFNKFPNILCK